MLPIKLIYMYVVVTHIYMPYVPVIYFWSVKKSKRCTFFTWLNSPLTTISFTFGNFHVLAKNPFYLQKEMNLFHLIQHFQHEKVKDLKHASYMAVRWELNAMLSNHLYLYNHSLQKNSPFIQSWVYSALHSRQWPKRNEPWASTSFSSSSPATLSNVSMFCRKDILCT